VDPQYWNFRHLDRQRTKKTRLIAESAVYPPVLRSLTESFAFAGTFLCGSLFPLSRFIEDRVENKGNLGAGGSVATTAWDFARILAPSAIWIAGLDLSFPENKTHFRGALFEDRSLAEAGRFVPTETWSFRALRDGHPFLAKSACGGQTLTDKRLSLYAAWFENRFRSFPDVKNFSLSPDGLAIGGLETAAPEALLALPERRDEIDRRLQAAFDGIEKDFSAPKRRAERAAGYEAAVHTLFEGLKTIKTLAEDAAEAAETALRRARRGRLSPAEQEKVLKKLDAANNAIMHSEVKEAAGFLFPDSADLEDGLESPAAETLNRHLEFSAMLYRALAEAVGYNLGKKKTMRLDVETRTVIT
jgi:hypothetical protein